MTVFITSILALSLAVVGSKAQFGRSLLEDVQPAPASIGTDVPLTYFGPTPSQVDKSLVGPFQLLKSGTLDEQAGTITLPIYKGIVDGGKGSGASAAAVYYVVTDTNDAGNAAALGLNFSPKLTYANVGRGARKAYLSADDGLVHFRHGRVDFKPKRTVVPGSPAPFPPKSFTAGSIGDGWYSPLFVLQNAGATVYNGPIIADGSEANLKYLKKRWCKSIPEGELEQAREIVHDKVLSICVSDDGRGGTVTLDLTPGFSFAKPVLYLSTDSSLELAAALEAATLAPALTSIKLAGDDSLFSAVERIFLTVNGYTNKDVNSAGLQNGPGEKVHPTRQGLNSALQGEGSPLNVLGGIPTVATDYSPMWDANIGEWTEYAVRNNYRVRLTEEFQILGLVEKGFITAPGGGKFGSSGFIVNCPIVFRFL